MYKSQVLPGISGPDVCREMRRHGVASPVIMVTARSSKVDVVVGLELGADDYITKPFHYPELRARIQRVLRRVGDRVPGGRLELGPELTLDLQRRRAFVNGQEVRLTPVESRLLYALAANLGQTVTTETLLARGLSDTEVPDPSYVWGTMARPRRKIAPGPDSPVYVETVRGVGYRAARG